MLKLIDAWPFCFKDMRSCTIHCKCHVSRKFRELSAFRDNLNKSEFYQCEQAYCSESGTHMLQIATESQCSANHGTTTSSRQLRCFYRLSYRGPLWIWTRVQRVVQDNDWVPAKRTSPEGNDQYSKGNALTLILGDEGGNISKGSTVQSSQKSTFSILCKAIPFIHCHWLLNFANTWTYQNMLIELWIKSLKTWWQGHVLPACPEHWFCAIHCWKRSQINLKRIILDNIGETAFRCLQ